MYVLSTASCTDCRAPSNFVDGQKSLLGWRPAFDPIHTAEDTFAWCGRSILRKRYRNDHLRTRRCWRCEKRWCDYYCHYRCITPVELTAIWHSIISIPTCFPLTSKTFLFRQSFPDFVLWLYHAYVGFVIVLQFSHTKKIDWHWHWHTNVSREGKAIGSVRLSVCLSVRLYPLYPITRDWKSRS